MHCWNIPYQRKATHTCTVSKYLRHYEPVKTLAPMPILHNTYVCSTYRTLTDHLCRHFLPWILRKDRRRRNRCWARPHGHHDVAAHWLLPPTAQVASEGAGGHQGADADDDADDDAGETADEQHDHQNQSACHHFSETVQ